MAKQNKNTTIRHSFVYPKIEETHREYGGSFLLNPIINPTGDWRKTLPPFEEQRREGVDSSACYIEAQQHSIATVEEFSLNELDNNYSARFNALLSNGGEFGGDPIKGADSIRHDGLVKEKSMPQKTSSWLDFHSWKGVNEEAVRKEGQDDLSKKERRFGIIITRDMSPNSKYEILRQGLMRSPIDISVYGATDETDNYIQKPEGVNDTHMVEVVYLDENNLIHVLDTYKPFEKILPPNYNFDFAMGWTVGKKTTYEVVNIELSIFQKIWSIIKSWLISVIH